MQKLSTSATWIFKCTFKIIKRTRASGVAHACNTSIWQMNWQEFEVNLVCRIKVCLEAKLYQNHAGIHTDTEIQFKPLTSDCKQSSMVKQKSSIMKIDVLIPINTKTEKFKNVVHQIDKFNSKNHVIILVIANKNQNKTTARKGKALLRLVRVWN